MGICLVMTTTTGNERPFPIQKNRTVIGRGATSDVRISVPTVAPRHCELTLDDTGLRMTDLGSAEGTLHNGNRVGEALLTENDRLTVGPITFEVRRVEDGGPGPAASMAEPKLAPGAPQPHQNRWSV